MPTNCCLTLSHKGAARTPEIKNNLNFTLILGKTLYKNDEKYIHTYNNNM